MIAIILALLLVGLLLILLEAIVPGGILGMAGGVLIAISVYLCFSHYPANIAGAYLAGSVFLAGGTAIAAFLYIMKRAALHPPAQASPRSHLADAEPGAVGSVVKTLNPTGTIEIADKRFMARSAFIQEEIPAGSRVVVTEVDGSYLVVRPADKTESS